ncbi:Glycosyltransferase family 1 protein [Mycena kentingensis (nom. inval.)]|nr:Glycosyltransferase family 1 protein [Mycena kentingensis (nom. inval.)]
MPSRAAKEHTPSSTPPTSSPLNKEAKRRQKAMRNKERVASSSLSVSPAPSSPLASSPPNDGIAPMDRREDRPSPSKYPTPLPDEEYDPLPVPGPSVPEGALVDLGIEDSFAAAPLEFALDESSRLRLVAASDDAGPLTEQPPSEPIPTNPIRSAPEPPYPPTPRSSDRASRRRSTNPSSSGPSRYSDQSGYGRPSSQQSEDGHMRSPQPPRSHAAAPRALSALSAALRTVQAVTSTATAYASSGYASYQQHTGEGRRASVYYTPAATAQRNGYGNGNGHGSRSEEEDEDEIIGARWAESGGARLLVLAYAGGVQVWDATTLGSVREVANLRIPNRQNEMAGPVLSAAVLPGGDNGAEIGILTPHALYVYNLSLGSLVASHAFKPVASPSAAALEAVKDEASHRRRGSSDSVNRGSIRERKNSARRVGDPEDAIGVPSAFESTDRFVLVTTHSPPSLVILVRSTLRVLYVIPAVLLAVPLPQSSSLASNSTSSSYGSPPQAHPGPSPPQIPQLDHLSTLQAPATPVAAINGRLLAFLAQSPDNSPEAEASAPNAGLASWGRTIGRFFSRSAPAASGAVSMLGNSPYGNAVLEASSSVLTAAGLATAQGGAGSWVRVVDLQPLLAQRDARGRGAPRDLHTFEAGRHPVGKLDFEKDGTRLVVIRRDGLGAGVWNLRPTPRMRGDELSQPTQTYKLRRGRTAAVVEAVSGSPDGQFIALATRRRTVHVFAVNPYGGKADVRSHITGRVRDSEVQTRAEEPPVDVHALVRMHLPTRPTAHQGHGEADIAPAPSAPLAITFIPSSSIPAHPLRSPISPASPTFNHSPTSAVRDVLVFDPIDGVLTLRRITLTLETPNTLTHAMGVPLPVSMSLPNGRLVGGTSMSASPPATYASSSYVRGSPGSVPQQGGLGGNGLTSEGALADLVGKESVTSTWNLRRRKGWAEIMRADVGGKSVVEQSVQGVQEDWLAQAELSTFSNVPRVLPRPIYLSHQFTFYTLGEDYHALIRRYQFGLRGVKIDVRREVEVSGLTSGSGGEAFVEGMATSSSPRAIHRRSRISQTSFDEPLANALAGSQYAVSQPVLPMLPNGTPSSFRNSIPIRAVAAGLGDGVAEGLGRLKREMRHQRQRQLARSPPVPRARGVGDDLEASVPLEFDEEDEDFIGVPPHEEPEVFLQVGGRVGGEPEDDRDLSANTSPSRSGNIKFGDESAVSSVSTRATSAHPLDDEMDFMLGAGPGGLILDDAGWTPEDNLAVEEAERFDEISAAGFLDEEQAAMATASSLPIASTTTRNSGKRGRKKGKN